MKHALRTCIFILLSAFVFSCSNDKKDDDPVVTTPGPKFTAVKSIINTNCALSGCHVSPTNAGGINFESNANIAAHASHIKEMAVDLELMPPPPASPLSEADQAKIADWVAAGGRITD